MKFRNQFLKYMRPAGNDGVDGGGNGGAPDPKPENTPPADDPKPSDREAELLKEIMKKKTKLTELSDQLTQSQSQLEKYSSVDLERYQALIANEDAARIAAEQAEQERLKAEGKIDELLANKQQEHQGILEQMRTQHAAELEAIKSEITDLDGSKSKLQQQIEQLTIGTAFGNSAFIREKLVSALTPERTKRLYGEHFDFEDGRVIGYDQPRGAAVRTKLVDKDGHPLGFEDAIARIIQTDADATSMLKSAALQGAGSNSNNNTPDETPQVGSGIHRILYALNQEK